MSKKVKAEKRMDVEEKSIANDKMILFNFVLLGGEVLVFDAKTLKYVILFASAQSAGFSSYKEHVDFQLEYGLWRLTLCYLAEYDRGLVDSNSKNSWIQTITSLTLSRLYEMIRILNYYDVPLLIDNLLQLIVSRWMHMPRSALRAIHPKAIFLSAQGSAMALRTPLEAINIEYTSRREDMLAICNVYIRTHDLVQLVDHQFLPHTHSFFQTNDHSIHDQWDMLLTSRGLFAKGRATQGQMGRGIVTIDHHNSRTGGGKIFEKDHVDSSLYVVDEEDWVPVKLPPNVEVISVACGPHHTIILTTDGLYGCGSNDYGRLGSSMDLKNNQNQILYVNSQEEGSAYTRLEFMLPIQLNMPGVLLIACGYYHTIVYTRKGLFACGGNGWRQLGIESAAEQNFVDTFSKVAFDNEVAALACGEYYSLILDKKGEVYIIGSPDWEDEVTHLKPHKLAIPARIVAMSNSFKRVLLLSDQGDVYLCGNDHEDYPVVHTIPVKIQGLPPIASIATQPQRSFFIDALGSVYTFGFVPFFISKQEEEAGVASDTKLASIPFNQPVLNITAADGITYFLMCDGMYVYENYQFSKVNIHLTDIPLCQGAKLTITSQQQRRMDCHQCGEQNQSLLGFHKETQRIFCKAKDCLVVYRQFRIL